MTVYEVSFHPEHASKTSQERRTEAKMIFMWFTPTTLSKVPL
jgi:hypothetical protein